MRAVRCLRIFGWQHERLYGRKEIMYNIHQVTEYLAQAVCHFGPLDDISSAVFENEHHHLSSKCHGTKQVHMQFARVLERKICLRAGRERLPSALLAVVSNNPKRVVNGALLKWQGMDWS